ncbi:excinuclease ABC subunit UvrC [Salinispirillum marinum]|uniref:UvrABC system protein C n=2 Tax=Saccharospirillaceae TaxID=255527 RepID=A0ABV8BCZ7_9GAMM
MSASSPSEFDAKAFVSSLTPKPGVYRMYGEDGDLLYVGKAKNLKNRVGSYFRARGLTNKTVALVQRIARIDITVTHSETEALLLEQTLIKSHRPPYNIMLVDDKGYPYIFLSSEQDWPGLHLHRGAQKKKGRYFGPFPSAGAVRESLATLQKAFKVRQCEDTVFSGRSRPCLQYQIKRCKAPCVGYVSAEEYAADLNKTERFLTGKNQDLLHDIEQQMDQAAAALEFEKAAEYRDQVLLLRKIQEQQHVAGKQGNVDVIAAVFEGRGCCVHQLLVRNGRLIGSKTHHPKPGLAESADDLIEAYIGQHYLGATGREIPAELLVVPSLNRPTAALLETALAEVAGRKVAIKSDVRGDRAKWRDLALTNASEQLAMHIAGKDSTEARFKALEDSLKLPEPIQRLECFDISHSHGEATVASCVVFDRQGPAKRMYRRFNIEGITGGDDYAAMRQALTRRYSRLLKEETPLPDLIIIDGGKGQLGIAQEVMAELGIQPRLLGIAKGVTRKAGMETLYLDDAEHEIVIAKHSPGLHLLQHIRDESHRFAIAGHRARRDKTRTRSLLDDIPGIGNERRKALVRHFGSGMAVKSASVDEIAKVKGVSRGLAQSIYDFLHSA